MLKCSTSLWSADLANLAAEMKRVEPYSERFHLDVADGHYVRTMLFFPDLVKALRPHTKVPFEIHLMTTDPLAWIEPFAEVGANGIIFCFDAAKDPAKVLAAIKAKGLKAGVSLLLTESLDLLEPHWQALDVLTIVGTAMGIKGASMDASVPGKIRAAQDHPRTRPDDGGRGRWRHPPRNGSVVACGGSRLHCSGLTDVQRRSAGHAPLACGFVNHEAVL